MDVLAISERNKFEQANVWFPCKQTDRQKQRKTQHAPNYVVRREQ